MSLPHFGEDDLDDREAGDDSPVRLSVPGGGRGGSQEKPLGRDYAKRALRREERAAARADLRKRFSQYRQLVRGGGDEYLKQSKEIKSERREALQKLRAETEAARRGAPRSESPEVRLLSQVAIDAESTRRRLAIEAVFQGRSTALRAGRTMALGWREWLHEQASLGDQAALSALRGIVYQAQRDAKNAPEAAAKEIEGEGATDPETQYRKVMARLLEEEKKEVAIRSARVNAMRAYEADVLLARYADIQWNVTGNGNVEYRSVDGSHLFTDRGNRLTFDRVLVTDDDIRLALLHSQQKFGRQLTLTGDDPVFTARMARLADDLGITVLNPELQPLILKHREDRGQAAVEILTMSPAVQDAARQAAGAVPGTPEAGISIETPEARLRAMVHAIDPRGTFVVPDTVEGRVQYSGPIVATLPNKEPGFAQHLGRSVYALHALEAPAVPDQTVVDILYRDGVAVVHVPEQDKGRSV